MDGEGELCDGKALLSALKRIGSRCEGGTVSLTVGEGGVSPLLRRFGVLRGYDDPDIVSGQGADIEDPR